MTEDQICKWTTEERAQIRAIVAHTCAVQGVPLAVPPDVARTVAALVAVGGRRLYRSPVCATADVLVAVLAGAGEADAPPAPD